jgi:hypothetical protein
MSAAKADKAPPANYTAQRLLTLEPGDSFTFYRGDLPADIANSKSAPAYARILEAVRGPRASCRRRAGSRSSAGCG